MNVYPLMFPLLWMQFWLEITAMQPAPQVSATILKFDRTYWRKKCL